MDTFKVVIGWFRPIFDAVFNLNLPFTLRWRLLALQPIALLTNTLLYLPEITSSDYTVIRIPTRRDHFIRAIVFQPQSPRQSEGLRPIHLDFHGGAFLGGNAEYDAPFCRLLTRRTRAVVISAEYRLAPRYTFPCAHDDAEDVLEWAFENAREEFKTDPRLLALDFRSPPWAKPKPDKMPKIDLLAFMMPLFDAYAGPARAESLHDPRLNPILADLHSLPRNILLIVPAIDILASKQLEFIQRVKQIDERHGRKRDV
ncbi:Hypothetical protein R9X50_00032700 [Acrodontium crateriforme]|uniref:Alpha/beta hydrolase fold-3 domain-containing protein n=1 Tax=Acrodontium crateriforme TaxID=150365 RepID=A0AAQ3M0F3_9PEZI|nr:Hypothetical protein R9X50_00032700 [Acrodontium crateriforme]